MVVYTSHMLLKALLLLPMLLYLNGEADQLNKVTQTSTPLTSTQRLPATKGNPEPRGLLRSTRKVSLSASVTSTSRSSVNGTTVNDASVAKTREIKPSTFFTYLAVIVALCGVTVVLVLIGISLGVYIKRLRQQISMLKKSNIEDNTSDDYDRIGDVQVPTATHTDEHGTT